MSAGTPDKSYKRLGFVVNSLNSTTGLADKAYKTVRSMAPQFLEPTVHSIEETVAAYGAPAIAKVQDAGDRLLHFTDNQLDTIVTTADKTVKGVNKGVADGVTSVRDLHETNMKTFSAAVTSYYDSIQRIADWAAESLNPVKGGRAAVDTLRAALARARELADPDEAAKAMMDAWATFSAIPPVQQVLKTTDPVQKAALNSFTQLHDSLVSMTLYKKVVDTGASTLDWATKTTPYRLGAQYVYPWLQGIADPALNTIAKSKIINDTVSYWKPNAAAA